MPSLCGSAWATREPVLGFAAHSFLACRPLRPGASSIEMFQSFDAIMAFAV